MRQGVEERFWVKVARESDADCWLWEASKSAAGYGKFSIRRSVWEEAHRVAWRLTFSAIPDGLCVLHRCDVRACVNPGHLFLGTRGDNNRDAAQKGRTCIGDKNGSRKHPERMQRGEARWNARIGPEQVVRIRAAYATGESQMAVGKRFGIGQTQVGRIVRRVQWCHVA
jgi:hypothetical protein